MVGIDFNLPLNFGQYIFMDLPKGLANAYRTDCFLTTDRLSSQEAIRQMRSQIRRQSSNKNFLLFRSIPVYGFCPDNISPVSSRHRGLPACHADKALSLRHSRKRVTQYVGKWIKQYLRIKTFFGTSENAVKTQIWTAISVYLLAAIVKKELKIERSLGEILQILSIVLFEKVHITQVLTKTMSQNGNVRFHNQLSLSNL